MPSNNKAWLVNETLTTCTASISNKFSSKCPYNGWVPRENKSSYQGCCSLSFSENRGCFRLAVILCRNNSKTNEWIESYIDWAEKKLRKEGKSIFYVKGYTETVRKMEKRKYSGCDCIIEKRIIALDTLSNKAADAIYESQENQCFDN